MQTQENIYPYVVFEINKKLFCVNCSQIDGMTQLVECTAAPDSPQEVRGMMKYRNALLTLLDLRVILNMGAAGGQSASPDSREMVLTLNIKENCGIVVERIHSVENLLDLPNDSGTSRFIEQTYIKSVKRSEKISGLILELDTHEIVRLIADYKPQQE